MAFSVAVRLSVLLLCCLALCKLCHGFQVRQETDFQLTNTMDLWKLFTDKNLDVDAAKHAAIKQLSHIVVEFMGENQLSELLTKTVVPKIVDIVFRFVVQLRDMITLKIPNFLPGVGNN